MRRLVKELYDAFEEVHLESVKLIEGHDYAVLCRYHGQFGASVCELIVRSAAMVEQCCGGITTRLWDDPFEWTLPESFSDKKSLHLYLEEVASVRNRAFGLIKCDADLVKEIAVGDRLRTLFSVLLESLNASAAILHSAVLASKFECSN